MQNDDLIAFLQPAPNHFHATEWRDATETIRDIASEAGRLTIRTHLPAGIYRGVLETKEGAFDMQTAMVEMTRVPDGARVAFGPWDLDHLHHVMAIPMALVTVNGRFRGGLWFEVPGPGKIAKGVLSADFGFEHEGGNLELELTLTPRDCERLSSCDLQFLELRHDDRRFLEWKPLSAQRPRFFTTGLGREALARKLRNHEGYAAVKAQFDLPVAEWGLTYESNGKVSYRPSGSLDLAFLLGYATNDESIVAKAKGALLTLCEAQSWSGRPDPLLMGGDNDRGIGYKLYLAAMGWEFLRDTFEEKERSLVLGKAEEYLGKMYDFTLLQRSYMGCPTPDSHSLGTWWGVGIACMAFYDELAIARKALPFFHALMVDGLSLFPPGGKDKAATFGPLWPARYFAAAIEFGGPLREVDESPFFDRLTEALLASFRTPNAQELQRGLRTVGHRALTAFLSHFHPAQGVAGAYAAFVEEERRQAGDVQWKLFDLLYAPAPASPASFPEEPFFSRETGDVIVVAGVSPKVNLQINGGHQSGGLSRFRVKPHNRERARSLGDFTLGADGHPVIVKLQGSYGLFSALSNALCFEEGSAEWDGQYLHGDIGPERSGFIRRFCRNERFVYTDVNFTPSLKTSLGVRYAQRIFLVDRQTGLILVHDRWDARAPLKVGTHLHASGQIREERTGCYRFTGGQANAIAGIKGGARGMSNAEGGNLYLQVLKVSGAWRAKIAEASWVPAYIYGLNEVGKPDGRPEEARYPKLQRWRLEFDERTSRGEILYALAPERHSLDARDGRVILPGEATYDYRGESAGANWRCSAEVVTHDGRTREVMALGVTRWESEQREIVFRVPVDICCNVETMSGVIHSPAANPVIHASGFEIGTPVPAANPQRSLFAIELSFQKNR